MQLPPQNAVRVHSFDLTTHRFTMPLFTFPPGFLWGSATSAYQIEGATSEDGRGESIWDRFTSQPRAIEDGSTGAPACDHYHRYADDCALMTELGHRAYRFSIAWPRVLPSGRGKPNERGLDFYRRLVDTLLEAKIVPFATLYHWDLPQALEDRGGWRRRETAEAFAEYADVVSRALGDRIKHWITHNEPWCTSYFGHLRGTHAPGVRDERSAVDASHHLLLSHGLAVPVLRQNSRGCEVGIVVNLLPVVPASPSSADYDAYRHLDGLFNRWYLDPLYGRGYPADLLRDYEACGAIGSGGFSVNHPGDLATIAASCDFLGVNYYMRSIARSDRVPEDENLPRTVHAAPAEDRTDAGWEVYPDGLWRILTRVHETYAPRKIYLTENGASYVVGPDESGRVADDKRIAFLRDHLVACHRAITAGVPLSGYFVWSLLDNFEWERGYTQRFGIVHVDYSSQRRTPKDSAIWYRDVIRANAVTGT